jgi:hypothetical protein
MHASILDFLLLVKKGQVVVFTPKLTKFVQTDRQRERGALILASLLMINHPLIEICV